MENLNLLKNDKRVSHLFFMATNIMRLKVHMSNFKKDYHSLRGLILLNKRFERALKYVKSKYKEYAHLHINLSYTDKSNN